MQRFLQTFASFFKAFYVCTTLMAGHCCVWCEYMILVELCWRRNGCAAHLHRQARRRVHKRRLSGNVLLQ